ncbi:MAG: amino acid adenylation domain-containing protein, partial [Nostoc sp.]
SVFTYAGAREEMTLDTSLYTDLKNTSARCECTLFTILLTAFMTLLGRLTHQKDIVIGIASAGQSFAESEYLVGHCVNLLPIRTPVVENPAFTEYLNSVKQVLLDAYNYQIYPFIRLVKNLNLPRDPSRAPLIAILFNLDKVQSESESLSKAFKLVKNPTSAAKYDITWNINQTDSELLVECDYNTELFDSQTIQRWMGHFRILLAGIVANLRQRLSELPLLTAAEQQLLVQWNDTEVEYPQHQCIHQLFEAQVERSPDAIAVVFEDQQLTYEELNQRANQLAHYLQQLGVGAEVLVGICVERSLFMVIGLLGILKAGGAYVPLDPTYPQERLAFILQDTQLPVLLTQQRLIENLPECQIRVVCLDTDWESIAQESQNNCISDCTTNNLAYIIYTSGSTGQPKGVLVNHRNVVRLLLATQSWYHFNQQDVFSLFHSIAFDFSVWELWGALLYGGQLVVIPYWVSRSPEDFYKLLLTQQVTVLNQTPSAFRQLIQAEELLGDANKLSLRLVIFGGEALEIQSLRPWFERHSDQFPQLVNMYGITETTVHVTYRPLTIADLEVACGSVIGRPISDLQVYLLDQQGQPVPIGVPGEMYIGGAGVARGYLNRPELTAQRFIPNSFSDKPNARLYKSGDKARYLPNGDIEYLGRIDHQVKVRGFRIELGEIENTLAKHQAVQKAVVLAREIQHGDKQLVAYIVKSNKQTPTISDLQNFLREHLPEYMVPSAFVLLEALPLTPNGKVDHRALPAPDTARPELEEVFVAPRTLEEKILAEIWAEVLGLEQVGIHDNFFALGGDSIRIIRVQSLAKEKGLSFSIQQVFQYQTIYQLLEALKTAELGIIKWEETQPFSLISQEDKHRLPDHIEDAYPLATLQIGMVFHNEYSPEGTTYHDVFSYHLQTPLEIQVLQAAIQLLVNRHTVLRTSFQLTDFTEPLQLIHRNIDVPFQVEDWHHLSTSEQEDALNAWLEEEKRRSFDWNIPPLLRFFVHRCSDETFYLTVSFHHAILDGWSVASMLTELFGHYFSLLGEKVDFLQPPPLSLFRDFVALERETLASGESQRYWTEKLHDSTITMLPRWHFSPAEGNIRQVGVEEVPISAEISQGLQQLAKSTGIPLKSVLLAAHLRVLNLLCGQSDVLTGVVSNGRLEHKDGERVLGLFLNSLPFRLNLSGGTWIDLVRDVFEVERDLLPHRRYPLAAIQRSLGGQPLFETLFYYTNFHVYQAVLGGKNLQSLGGKFYEETNFSLTANFGLDSSSFLLKLSLQYKASEFGLEQIKSISGYYARTLQAIVSTPQERYELHELLSTQERHQLLLEWNNTQTNYPINQCIHQLFEAQVERTPDAVAVVFEDQQLTYKELNQRANQLAHYLRSLGVKPEVLVGICVERSLSMVIGLLGILKAGGAYVPLDPAYPPSRLAFMLSDSQVPVLLTQQQLVAKLPEHQAQVVCLDTDWNIIAQQSQDHPVNISEVENLAYVIYTSGSTGQPKGVFGLHRGTVNRFYWMWQNYPFVQGEVCCQKTSLNFVDSVWEIFGALLKGVTTVIVPDEVVKDPQQFVATLAHNNVTRLVIVPSLLRILLNTSSVLQLQLPQLKLWISSGEALSIDLLGQFRQSLPDSILLNLYGSSEVSGDVSCYSLSPQKPLPECVLIGRAIANTHIYVLDAYRQPVPIGVPGELYIGGDGLARGYLNQSELTAEKFISNPFSNKLAARLYKTGDLARYLPNGEIEYIGRIDHQVKIRGFRIELPEIEARLTQHPTIREAVVVVREDVSGDKWLVAYVVCEHELVPILSELRSFLKENLPDYMVPTAFVPMKALPLTPNGKVDRQALPVSDNLRPQLEATYIKPQTDLEKAIATVWQKSLKLEKVGINDNFFELGGHSLLIVQVHNQLRQIFPANLSMLEMFRYPTISSLAEFLNQTNKKEPLSIHKTDTRTEQLKDGKTRIKQFLTISKRVKET